jgi:hypothetical protein
VPIAATMPVEISGPIPGTLISRRHVASNWLSFSISPVTVSMRSSSRHQSSYRPRIRPAVRGDIGRYPLGLGRTDGSLRQSAAGANCKNLRCRETGPCGPRFELAPTSIPLIV